MEKLARSDSKLRGKIKNSLYRDNPRMQIQTLLAYSQHHSPAVTEIRNWPADRSIKLPCAMMESKHDQLYMYVRTYIKSAIHGYILLSQVRMHRRLGVQC
jgi:hypothetical protein